MPPTELSRKAKSESEREQAGQHNARKQGALCVRDIYMPSVDTPAELWRMASVTVRNPARLMVFGGTSLFLSLPEPALSPI